MQTPSIIDDPSHWKRRADEARRLAGQLDDPVAKKTMLEIGLSYEQLAALAEKKLTLKTIE